MDERNQLPNVCIKNPLNTYSSAADCNGIMKNITIINPIQYLMSYVFSGNDMSFRVPVIIPINICINMDMTVA